MNKDNLEFEEVRYIYNIPNIGIFESTTVIDELEFASIEELEKEINEQGSFLYFIPNTSQLEEDSPLTDYKGRGGEDIFVVCKEGVFGFEDDKYTFVGKFLKDNVQRVRSLEIPDTTFVSNDSNIQLIKAGTYEILNTEEIELINGKKHTIFEIETLDCNMDSYTLNQKIKIKVPDYPGIFSIIEYDLLAIDYTEEFLIQLGLL